MQGLSSKHIEVSRKIRLTREASQEQIKQALLDRLRRAFVIGNLKEHENGFHFEGTSGGRDILTRHASMALEVQIQKHQEMVRIVIHGFTRASAALIATYSILFLAVLFVGLLPGSIDTSGETSDALDALVFVIFGIFIFYDVNSKLLEARQQLRDVLESLDTEFG